MASLQKKIRDENDKNQLQKIFGKRPKHRCSECHRFSIWMNNSNFKGCVMCELIRRTREERKNANNTEIGDNRPNDTRE